MQRSIIVGFDGSDRGRDALALAHALGNLLGARLVVVVAYTPAESMWAPGLPEPLDQAGDVLALAQEALSHDDTTAFRTVASPSAAGALHAEAEREQAELIVVGSSHRGILGRVLVGSTAQQTLDAAPCAVAIAPVGLVERPPVSFDRIGVGFDDSPEAHNALGAAHALARAAGAQLRVLWVANLGIQALPHAALSYFEPDYFERVRKRFEARLARAVAHMHDDIAVSTAFLRGHTTAALVKASAELDLLVVGSRCYGPLRRVLPGSVSRQLAQTAHCPVLVIPRGIATLRADAEPLADAAKSR